MTFYGASYLPPTSKGAMFDSTSFNRANEGLTYQTALDNFLAYPSAQGTENLKTTNISGLTTLTNNLIMHGAGNYIEFPDASQQTTAFIEANYAQLNTDNTFLSPYIQTFQGATGPSGGTAPLRIAGNNNEYISFYIDPTPELDATLYSAQTAGGLTLRNAGGNSFTVTPSAPNNTAYFSNPIATSLGISAGTLTVATSGTINGSNIATEGRANVYTGINNFNGNLNGGTTTAQGLTIGRNNETGYNELDLISLNATTTTGLNIYAETTSVNTSSTPKLTIYNDTTPALLNAGLTIASGATNPITLFTGNFQGAGSNLQTSGKFVAGGTLTVYNNNSGSPHWVDITCPNLNLEISTGLAITTVGQTNQVVFNTSASGLTVDDSITATGSLTSTTGVVNLVGSSFTSGGGAVNVNSSSFGIINTSLLSVGVSLACPATNVLQIGSGNGGLNCGAINGSQLTLTSGGNTTGLTTTASGLSVNDPITVPSQTYPLTSSSQVSTISYVNSAVAGATQQVRTGLTYTIPSATSGTTYIASNTISSYTSTIFTTGAFSPTTNSNIFYLNFNEPLYNGTFYYTQIQSVFVQTTTGTVSTNIQFSVQSPTQLRLQSLNPGTAFNYGNTYYFNINCVITST